MALIREPGARQRYTDSVDFRNHVFQSVIIDFGHDIKEATQGRALVGARTGNFQGNNGWIWPTGYQETDPMDELAASPDFDFFDVQEPYVGRSSEGTLGSGAPVIPAPGMAQRGKLIVIQNDWRTHTGPDKNYGATPNMAATVQTQRRVFVNCLTNGTYPYLWQMSYNYDTGDQGQRDLTLVNEYAKQEAILEKAFSVDRGSPADVAIVFDPAYKRYFGYDPRYGGPSRQYALFDYSKFTWARAGLPFDMIYLDQLPTAKPYKVYIFMHTLGLTDAQIGQIQATCCKDRKSVIFVWGDGLLDGSKMDASRMAKLTGMNIQLSTPGGLWNMSPTGPARAELGVPPTYLMGTPMQYVDPNTPTQIFSPSFVVDDSSATPMATYVGANGDPGGVGIARKDMGTWLSIYTASAIVPPAIIRYAASRAGAFEYVESEDNCYVDNSFVGLNVKTTGNVTLHLPARSALYDLFNDVEYPANTTFSIPVAAGNTYLFFRGDKAAWQALPTP